MPATVARPETERETVHDPGWRVVVLNDDVTPIDLVVAGLQRAAGLSEEVAEMIAVEAHNQGEAVVKRGLERSDAEAVCVRLRQYTRLPRICPGVGCRTERDE